MYAGVCPAQYVLVFRWAKVLSKDFPEEDRQLHKMVMNIGQNPTVNPADAETTVELHIMHKFDQNFYGQPVCAMASGFIRSAYASSGASSALCVITFNIP